MRSIGSPRSAVASLIDQIRSHPILVSLVVLLKVGDAVTTFYGLRYGDAHEANPFSRFVFDAIGLVPGLVLITVAFVLVVLALTAYSTELLDDEPLLGRPWLSTAYIYGLYAVPIGLYTLVVASNLSVILG